MSGIECSESLCAGFCPVYPQVCSLSFSAPPCLRLTLKGSGFSGFCVSGLTDDGLSALETFVGICRRKRRQNVSVSPCGSFSGSQLCPLHASSLSYMTAKSSNWQLAVYLQTRSGSGFLWLLMAELPPGPLIGTIVMNSIHSMNTFSNIWNVYLSLARSCLLKLGLQWQIKLYLRSSQ